MPESDTSHPALVAGGRAISAGALAVVVVVSAYLAFRVFMSFPACPLAPVADPSAIPPSCMITPLEPTSAARSQGLLTPVIGTLTTEPHPALVVVVLGAAGVRSAIRHHWPGVNRRETTN